MVFRKIPRKKRIKMDNVVKCTPPAVSVPKPRKIYEADQKDRTMLLLTWGIGIFLFRVLWVRILPGLGITLTVYGWYVILLWYQGREGLKSWPSRLLLAAILLLGATFTLYSNPWFRLWNIAALCILTSMQMFQWSGQGCYGWNSPLVLAERLLLTLRGLFGVLPASADTLRSFHRDRRFLAALWGFLVAVPVLGIIVPLLFQADQYFAIVAGELLKACREMFGEIAVQILLGTLVLPFLFGLCFCLRHSEKREKRAIPAVAVDALIPCVTLAVMDLLYGFFIAVQFTVLFGGPEYLERVSGLTYAEYARSGFFQLVFVAGLNLTLVLTALQLGKQEEKGQRMLRVLATTLILMSGVILYSAAYRMTLYVSVYGLSFKRFLTYWGMVILGIFLVLALLKVWKRNFSYFKVAFAVSVAGWLVLNFCNVDRLVARYNVALYQQEQTDVIDLNYLVNNLSYDALPEAEALLENGDNSSRLAEMVENRRERAALAASDWRTWSVSAYLAAK